VCGSDALQRMMREEAGQLLGRQDKELLDERRRLRQSLATIEEQFRRWADAYTSQDPRAPNAIPEAQFFDFNAELSRRRAAGHTRLEEVETSLSARNQRQMEVDAVLKALEEFPRVWDRMEAEERRQLVQTLVVRISVEREGRDLWLRLKVCLMPEERIPVPTP